MDHQSLVSPVMLAQPQHLVGDSRSMLHEQVERDTMLQSYPDYLDLPYNVPSSDYSQPCSWYPQHFQSGVQSEPYLDRPVGNKVPVDWPTSYNTEQGNYIQSSPQGSPYMQTQHEVSPLVVNGECAPADQPCENNCLPLAPVIHNHTLKDPEQQVKELLASTRNVTEETPLVNGKKEETTSTKLPGFHQAFGSTEIGRFSQPDGFFEAAVAAEQERKVSMSPLPPPPPRRGRAPRGGRKAKSRIEHEKWPNPCFPMGNQMAKKDSWQEWNPGMQSGCDSPMNSLQRMNCYPYHEDQRPTGCHPDMYQHPHPHSHPLPHPPQWYQENCNQYYPPYYNSPQSNYHDSYPPYDYPPPGWRGHPYYHPNHYPHHQYYQQYSEYRHYNYQNNRWAVNREVKYSSGMV